MKTLGIKSVLSAVAVAALVASPAFAKSHRVVYQDNAAVGYVDAAPGYATAAPGNDIPAYDSQGSVVGIANPDQYGVQWQR
ncbi:MAG TPA: hypothetical protein VMA30_09170 [Xanthobacteraceae bacterium]|nr:hypothetical protein [Xanthobacteraceae bacterium]